MHLYMELWWRWLAEGQSQRHNLQGRGSCRSFNFRVIQMYAAQIRLLLFPLCCTLTNFSDWDWVVVCMAQRCVADTKHFAFLHFIQHSGLDCRALEAAVVQLFICSFWVPRGKCTLPQTHKHTAVSSHPLSKWPQ